MSYTPRSLFRLLEEIDAHRLLLPHIQRPFVWDRDQMALLFDSLMREYPIQTFLFWRTKEEIRARRFMSVVDPDADLSQLYDLPKSAAGVEKVFVLDGQQRLQTLHSIFRIRSVTGVGANGTIVAKLPGRRSASSAEAVRGTPLPASARGQLTRRRAGDRGA